MKDLTTGKTANVLIKYTIPLFVSVVFQQMYNIADSVIAGKFAGEDALASVGASYPITNIFNAVAIGSNIGCSVLISQLFGAKRNKEVKSAIYTSLISCVGFSVLLTAVGIFFTPSLMELIKTPENIFSDSALYLKIYIGGFGFLYLYNIATGIFTSLGDSKTPLYFLIFSSVGNVILDYVFVRYFNMGVSGVAWATFIAQGVAGILSVITLFIYLKQIKTEEKPELFSFPLLKRICGIAVPSILQQSFVSVGNIFIQAIINGYGSSVIAGYSAAIKLNTFCINSLCTFSSGISGFTAQNVGAKKPERIKECLKNGSLMCVTCAFLFTVIYTVFNKQFIGFFMEGNGGAQAVSAGTMFLKIVSPAYCCISFKIACDGVLRGTGSMAYFMIATFTDLVLRVVLAYILSPLFGSSGIWASWPAGWLLSMVLSFLFYKKVMKNILSKGDTVVHK